MLFFQHYPRFNRFICKLFLTDALRYFGGSCGVCIVQAVQIATNYGLYDLERLEQVILRSLSRDFFFVAPETSSAHAATAVSNNIDLNQIDLTDPEDSDDR